MALDLNANVSYDGKEYFGRATETIPQLIRDGRVPETLANIMRQRIKYNLLEHSLLSGNLAVFHPDRKFKIILNNSFLGKLNPESELDSNGGLILPYGAYEILQCPEFSLSSMERFFNRPLTRELSKTHPVWQAVANDQGLLDAYVDFMFSKAEKRKIWNAMGVYMFCELPSSGAGRPWLRMLVAGNVRQGAELCGYESLEYDGTRMIGVVPSSPIKSG